MRFLSLIFIGILSIGSAIGQEKIGVRIKLDDDGLTMRSIPADMDVAGINIQNQTVDLIINSDQYEMLILEGYELQVLPDFNSRARLDAQYLTYNEILGVIQELLDQHPDLVHVKEIGRSLQGRRIYAVRISSPDNLAAKPSVVFNGMHHAREVMTTEVTTDIMRYLAQNYGVDDTVTQWLDNIQVWVVPQVNPDGNNIVWTSDRMWRKNARGEDDDIWGVDINRNYPFAWNSCNGSSGSKGSQTFRGESAGSEPETQALMNLIKATNAVMNVSYHSYSELVLAPYGCQGEYTPEDFIFKHFGQPFAKRLVKDSGSGSYTYGTGWETLYSTDGDDTGWMYNEVNTLAYVVEINADSQGFQPSYSKWRNITVERQRKGWQFLLNQMLVGPQIRGRIYNAATGEPMNAEIKIAGLKFKNKEKHRRSQNGYFYKMMAPGEFQVEFMAPGFQTEIVPVLVDTEAIDLEVAMTPNASMLRGR